MDISEINTSFPAIFDVFFFCIGACVGSFLNVCIYRIPAGESVIKPPSHCACGEPIRWFDNLPIIGWFLLAGKARCCGRKISFRYPFVELLTAAIFLTLWILGTPQTAIGGMVFASILIFCTFVDIDHMMLPDAATVGGAIAGFLISVMMPQIHAPELAAMPMALQVFASAALSILGIVVGSGVLYWMRILGQAVFRKEAMGEGDVLLIGCIGAFCGWQGALFAIFGGSVIGAFATVPIVATKRFMTRKAAKAACGAETADSEPLAVPFGPWLAMGALIYYIFMSNWVDAYFASVGRLFAAQ